VLNFDFRFFKSSVTLAPQIICKKPGFCITLVNFSKGGALKSRAEIIPLEPDPGNSGEGKI
jgi:hypothetical protein